MSEPPAELGLLVRLRNGDEAAASEVVDLYADRLVRLASRRIGQRLLSRIGAEDIVQSVFRTFFQRARQGEFHFADRDDMTRLLARITLRKTFRQVAHHLSAKRSPLREAVDDDSQKFLLNLLAREPAVEEAVALLDEMESLLSGLKEEDRRIVEMKLQGYTSLEIADQLGVSDRKVRRLMERLRSLAAGDPLAADPPAS